MWATRSTQAKTSVSAFLPCAEPPFPAKPTGPESPELLGLFLSSTSSGLFSERRFGEFFMAIPMNHFPLLSYRSLSRFLTVVAASGAPCAWAQAQPPVGTITFAAALAGAAQPVPTMAQWALVILSLLMVPVAWRAARGRMGCWAWAAGPGFLTAVMLMTSWSRDADAVPVEVDVVLDNPAGGSADIPYHAALDLAFADFMHQYGVRNTTTQSLRITGITLTPAHNDRDPRDPPRCTVGMVLAAGERCYLLVSKPH